MLFIYLKIEAGFSDPTSGCFYYYYSFQFIEASQIEAG